MGDPQRLISLDRLKVISVNVNSVVNTVRRDDLSDFLREHTPDVCLVCETKLSRRHRLAFDNYILVRQDRRNSILGGGVAILIRNFLQFEVINSPVVKNFVRSAAAHFTILTM